jgi:hypothetical protein
MTHTEKGAAMTKKNFEQRYGHLTYEELRAEATRLRKGAQSKEVRTIIKMMRARALKGFTETLMKELTAQATVAGFATVDEFMEANEQLQTAIPAITAPEMMEHWKKER